MRVCASIVWVADGAVLLPRRSNATSADTIADSGRNLRPASGLYEPLRLSAFFGLPNLFYS
jgi:hypothetical protein